MDDDVPFDEDSTFAQLRQREDELRKLNEELERRKEVVTRHAQEAARAQDVRLSGSSQLSSGSRADAEELPPPDAAATPAYQPATSMLPSYFSDPEARYSDGVATPRDTEAHAGHGDADTSREPAGDDDMAPEATVRYQRAKIRVLEEELSRLITENKDLTRTLRADKQKYSADSQELGAQQRKVHVLQTQLTKATKHSEEASKKLESCSMELRVTKQDHEALKRSTHKDKSNQSRGDVRLNRALEELDKYKGLLQEQQASETDRRDVVRRDNDTLLRENKRLERQKADLIAAFRKQMKLIDILKRQKLHVEAARMLAFSEEEFAQCLHIDLPS